MPLNMGKEMSKNWKKWQEKLKKIQINDTENGKKKKNWKLKKEKKREIGKKLLKKLKNRENCRKNKRRVIINKMVGKLGVKNSS